jgi:hypothetical protein
MPILPLDYPDPFAATLGVMLFPGIDNDDPSKARAFAAGLLATPLKHFHDAGHRLSYDSLVRITTDASYELEDYRERFWGGTATGELFKACWALVNTDPALASWNNAVKVAKLTAGHPNVRSSRSEQWGARSRFISVAHLWAALSIREYQFRPDPSVEYEGWDDFQSFLAEAEFLRDFGQKWHPLRARSRPLLPADVWRVPESWSPPPRRPDWPVTGQIPPLRLPDDVVTNLRPAGRPPRPR